MTPEAARSTLRTVADNPSAMASQAELAAVLDAVVTLFGSIDTAHMPAPLAALRSPKAAWRAVHTHAEHRGKSA